MHFIKKKGPMAVRNTHRMCPRGGCDPNARCLADKAEEPKRHGTAAQPSPSDLPSPSTTILSSSPYRCPSVAIARVHTLSTMSARLSRRAPVTTKHACNEYAINVFLAATALNTGLVCVVSVTLHCSTRSHFLSATAPLPARVSLAHARYTMAQVIHSTRPRSSGRTRRAICLTAHRWRRVQASYRDALC